MPITYGFHPSIDRGIGVAIEQSIGVGAHAVQIWTGSNKSFQSKMIPPDIYEPVSKLVKENDVFLIAHSPYILNFARSFRNDKRPLQRYVNDLINIYNLGGKGSVLHMGSNIPELHLSTDEAYTNFIDNLDWVVQRIPEDVFIILENMAGGGKRLCCQLKDWSKFWNDYIDDDLKKHVRWCVDTAHLYASGEYDISKVDEVQRFYTDFNENIGWSNILCFHFNGNKSSFGGHVDRHEDIGPVNCGSIKTAGLKYIAQLASKHSQPLILETPTNKYHLLSQFDLIKSWQK